MGLNGAFVMTEKTPLIANRIPPTVEATQVRRRLRRKASIVRPATSSSARCMRNEPLGSRLSMMNGWKNAADCCSPANGCPSPSNGFHSGTCPFFHICADSLPSDCTVHPSLASMVWG